MNFNWLPRRSPRRSRITPFRVEELESRCTPAVSLFTVPGTAGQQTTLDFSWTQKSAANNNELGVYVVQDANGSVNGLLPTDAGYAASALSASQVVFAKGQSVGAKTELTFATGTLLGFVLVQNNTIANTKAQNDNDQLTSQSAVSVTNSSVPLAFFSVSDANPDAFDHVQTQANGDGTEQFSWEDSTGGGDKDFNDMIMTVGAAGAKAVATPGQAGQTVTATFTWDASTAWFKDELGLYVTNNAEGLVNGFKPGDAGYENAALSDPSRQIVFQRFSGPGTTTTLTLPAGSFFGFYLVAQGTTAQALAGGANAPHVYFAFPSANSDSFDHLRWSSPTNFAFEDGLNGGDQNFNDVVGHFSFGTPTGTPSTDSAPFVSNQIGPMTLAQSANATIDLAGKFDDADIQNTIVQINTSSGPIDLELFDRAAPQTVANFLNYLNSGRFNDSIFHRLSQNGNSTTPPVLQGGGFTFDSTTKTLNPIVTDTAVKGEPDPVNRSNVAGTIAMALQGTDQNSGTDEFFFNLANNAHTLDPQNFTVFGKVVGASDMAVVNTLASIPTQDESNAAALPASEQGVFSEIPLQNYTGTNFPTDTTLANYAAVTGGSIVSRPEFLTYSVVANSNPAVVSTSVVNERLSLQAGTTTGTTTITVRATDQSGKSVDTTFTVTVN